MRAQIAQKRAPARVLRAQPGEHLIGEKGSVAIKNNEIINCDSTKVDKILDLTGAGDLFAAGFLKEYLEKSEIKKCLVTGSALAAKVIQKIGARLN
jgi:fructokinase